MLNIYQINASHKLLTKTGHVLSHVLEELHTHEHHDHHEHNHTQKNDHEHAILVSFEKSFNEQAASPNEKQEKTLIIRINLDKHLYKKISTSTVTLISSFLKRHYLQKTYKELFPEIISPPPQIK